MKKAIYIIYVGVIVLLLLCGVGEIISASTLSLIFFGLAIVITFLFVGGYPMEHIHFETQATLKDRQRRKGNLLLWKLLCIWGLPLAIAMLLSYLMELNM